MSLLTPLAVRIGAIPWLPRLVPQITGLDRLLHRLTGGHWSLLQLAGLPSLMLTVRGRRTGRPRTTPLLGVPWGPGRLIAGSNFGQPRPPAWVVNVRAAAQVQYSARGRQRRAVPRELTGAERGRAWEHLVRTWPNYQKYAERTDRVIPVFYLDPTD